MGSFAIFEHKQLLAGEKTSSSKTDTKNDQQLKHVSGQAEHYQSKLIAKKLL
jgi:hypothetical protein